MYLRHIRQFVRIDNCSDSDDDDYDIDFYTVEPAADMSDDSQSPQPSPREQLEVRWNLQE